MRQQPVSKVSPSSNGFIKGVPMPVYRVLDPSGNIINHIEWDGVSHLGLPVGYTTLEGDEDPPPAPPAVEVGISTPGIALSRSRQIFSGRTVEFAVFAQVGTKIAPHTHETGHYAILVNGRVRTQAEGQDAVTLEAVGQKVYFPAGVSHWLDGEEAGSVCLQVHDVARNS